MQSIVDYTRSPDATQSAAIDPVFNCTPIANEGGQRDFAFYWTGTTHAGPTFATHSVYIPFGRALGFMSYQRSPDSRETLMDVHGAGAQRSDPCAHIGHGFYVLISSIRCAENKHSFLRGEKWPLGFTRETHLPVPVNAVNNSFRVVLAAGLYPALGLACELLSFWNSY